MDPIASNINLENIVAPHKPINCDFRCIKDFHENHTHNDPQPFCDNHTSNYQPIPPETPQYSPQQLSPPNQPITQNLAHPNTNEPPPILENTDRPTQQISLGPDTTQPTHKMQPTAVHSRPRDQPNSPNPSSKEP